MCFLDLLIELQRQGINFTDQQVRWAIRKNKITRRCSPPHSKFELGGGLVLHNHKIDVDVPGSRLLWIGEAGQQLVLETLDVFLDSIDNAVPGGPSWGSGGVRRRWACVRQIRMLFGGWAGLLPRMSVECTGSRQAPLRSVN
jgi:hypothetical protein